MSTADLIHLANEISDDGLPEGWLRTQLGQVTWPSKEKIEPSRRPEAQYLGLEHVEAHTSKILGHGLASSVKSTKTVFRSGDVLYGKLRPYLNKVALPDFEGVCSTDFLVFDQKPWLASKFLLWFLLRREVVEHANHHSTGVELPRINYESLSAVDFFLPPLSEQYRIVARIEQCVAQINSVRDRLARVPAILKRFRQAVLEAACSGKLTADWRSNTNDGVGADQCLEISLEMRSKLWLEREANKQKRKAPSKNAKVRVRRYEEPFDPQLDSLENELPSAWVPATVSQLALLDVGFAFPSPEFKETGVRLLRGENIEPGSLRWLDVKCWPQDKMRGFEDLMVQEGESILAMDRPVISSGLKLARTKLDDVPCLLVQRVMRFKVPFAELAGFLHLRLQTADFLRHVSGGLTGSDLPHVTGTNVAEYTFGLPPLAEQQEIGRRVNALMAIADTIAKRVDQASARVEKLIQSVLAKAFRGELVPTEAELARREGREYEPASVLLERIEKQREPVVTKASPPKHRRAKA